jgi:hypothetical protein
MTTQVLAEKAKNNMKLPPSIISKNILCDIPNANDYGCYLYRFIDTKHELEADYTGIKKDKLPEHGGKPYWGSATDEEFNRLVQGDEPRFIFEIREVTTRDNYDSLQLKEYRMLKKYPDIKNNPATYNLSYGIPPMPNVDNDLLSEKFIEWFDETIESGIWTSEKDESVAELHAMETVQIRNKDSLEHIKDIKAELVANGCNTSDMDPVLIFQGVGKIFGFDKDCDVVVGSRHGLNAAKQVKALYMKTDRVPYEYLKDRSELFLRNLASHDNKDNTKLKYLPTKEDGAKLLVNLYNKKKISPDSDIAKEQVYLAYKLKKRKLTESIKLAKKQIEEQKRGNVKWKDYTKKELDDISEKRSTDKQLHTTMPSGFYDIYKLFTRIVNDIKERKYCVVWMHHKDPDGQTSWHKREADELKFLYEILNLHRKESTKMIIEFRTLDPWISDTENTYEAIA